MTTNYGCSISPCTTGVSAIRRQWVMMHLPRLTLEQDRARRINAEGALYTAYLAERNQPPPF